MWLNSLLVTPSLLTLFFLELHGGPQIQVTLEKVLCICKGPLTSYMQATSLVPCPKREDPVLKNCSSNHCSVLIQEIFIFSHGSTQRKWCGWSPQTSVNASVTLWWPSQVIGWPLSCRSVSGEEELGLGENNSDSLQTDFTMLTHGWHVCQSVTVWTQWMTVDTNLTS